MGHAGEKLDDDLRNMIWKGYYLRPRLRVPYDREFSFKRNELGELVNESVVMFAPYQRERWQVVHDSRRLAEVPSVAVLQYHPIGVESVPSLYLTSVFGGRLGKQTRHYRTPGEAFAAMRGGEVDAVVALRGELDSLHRLATRAYPQMGRQVWDIGMAVHESNRQLAYAIEEQLGGLTRSGRQRLCAGYGLRYELPKLYREQP